MICIPPCRERSEIANQDIQFSAGCRSISPFEALRYRDVSVPKDPTYQNVFTSCIWEEIHSFNINTSCHLCTVTIDLAIHPVVGVSDFCKCIISKPLIYRWPFSVADAANAPLSGRIINTAGIDNLRCSSSVHSIKLSGSNQIWTRNLHLNQRI